MNWKLIVRGLKSPILRNKLLAVFGILLVYRMLSHIPIPLAEPTDMKQLIENLINNKGIPDILFYYNLLSGGALASLSIMLVGLGPYINASIVMQVLTRALPKLEAMQKEGEYGRKRINQYTRILTLPLAIIQSVVVVFWIRQIVSQVSGLGDVVADAQWTDWVLIIATLTAGAMILMWLGELITERKIGNGISLLITVAIVSQLPVMVTSIYRSLAPENTPLKLWGWELPVHSQAIWYALAIVAATLLLTLFVVYLNEAQRRIKLSYAKRLEGRRIYGDVSSFLPLKLISAGVVPIIFALAFLSLPQLLGQILSDMQNPAWSGFADKLLLYFSMPGTRGDELPAFALWTDYIYPTVYFLLVVLFTYFYTSVVFSAKDIAERLQRQGGFIEGVRPGLATQTYLSKTVSRLNFFGSISLGFLALTPILAQAWLGDAGQLALGGTSILILVAVALETLRQIESQALMVTYEDYDNNFNQPQVKKTKTKDK